MFLSFFLPTPYFQPRMLYTPVLLTTRKLTLMDRRMSSSTNSLNIAWPVMPPTRTAAMASLINLPPLRGPVPRPGRNPHTNRPSNLEAWLGHVAGQVQAPGAECRHCVGGYGQWVGCVTVTGHFGGSCTNCHYGSEGARCSLRKNLLTGCL